MEIRLIKLGEGMGDYRLILENFHSWVLYADVGEILRLRLGDPRKSMKQRLLEKYWGFKGTVRCLIADLIGIDYE